MLEYDINGDLVQLYRNGVPDTVRVYNTPVRGNEYLNGNIACRPGLLGRSIG